MSLAMLLLLILLFYLFVDKIVNFRVAKYIPRRVRREIRQNKIVDAITNWYQRP